MSLSIRELREKIKELNLNEIMRIGCVWKIRQMEINFYKEDNNFSCMC